RNDPDNAPVFARGIDLVDGSVVRQNPLPALFSFLRTFGPARDMTAGNDAAHPAIHVVYGVPVEGQPLPEDTDGRRRPRDAAFRNTVVDVGLASLRLSQRRDTQLEVRQTNIISRIESAIPRSIQGADGGTLALFADEIAPSRDLTVGDKLNPSPAEVL